MWVPDELGTAACVEGEQKDFVFFPGISWVQMAMVVSSSVHSRLLGSLNSQCTNSRPSSSCSFSPLCRHLSGKD